VERAGHLAEQYVSLIPSIKDLLADLFASSPRVKGI
jgi:hypothetical protein